MEKILYVNEHLRCPDYKCELHTDVEEKYLEAGQVWYDYTQIHKLIFILDGKALFCYHQALPITVEKGHFMLLSIGKNISLTAQTDSCRILTICLTDKISLCNNFRIDKLWNHDAEAETEETVLRENPFLLKTIPLMDMYIELLTCCYREGLRCRYYLSGKIRELFYLLRAFYSKEQLYFFFYPLRSNDEEFTQRVLMNYAGCRSVAELAEKLNYSVSGFEKHFKKVFNEPPYRWMMQQKAQQVYRHINEGRMSFKQISDMFGFSSPSVMNDFIRQIFGKTPGQIRKGGNEE